MPREVSRAFDALPASIGKRLLQVRALIFATAAAHDDVGRLAETLKWGEPAYLTDETGSGSTIRLGRVNGAEPFCSTARRPWSTPSASAFPTSSNTGRRGRCCCRYPARCQGSRCRSACRWRCAIIWTGGVGNKVVVLAKARTHYPRQQFGEDSWPGMTTARSR